MKPFLLLLTAACTLALFLIWLGLPVGDSTVLNYAWSAQYSQTVSWANPIPRYLPDLWLGLGGHDFFFYAPLPFWFIATIVAPLCPWCTSSTEFVLGAAIFLALSGLTMFAFLRVLFASGPAAAGAFVYMILPYHLAIDWIQRQAAGEFAAYAFLPLIALGMERVRIQQRHGWILAVGVAGVFLCHLPTALLAAHVFGLIALAFAVTGNSGASDSRTKMLRLGAYAGLGAALSSFYWLPAVVLLDSVSPAALYEPHFEAWRWLIWWPLDGQSTKIALNVIVSFLVCLPILVMAAFFVRGATLIWIVVPTVVVVFLNLGLSELIWRTWIIGMVQFPWRLMVFADLASATAFAALAAAATSPARKAGFAFVAALLLLPTVAYLGYKASDESDFARGVELQDWPGAIEYLSPELNGALARMIGQDLLGPFDHSRIVVALPDIVAELQKGDLTGTIVQKQDRSILAVPPPGTTYFSIPVQYWVLWEAETDGGIPLTIKADPTFGTIAVSAPPGGFGDELIRFTLRTHPSEHAGWAITALALIVTIALIVQEQRKSRFRVA